MSVDLGGPPSPSPSLIEVKEETRLVLKSFLGHALSITPADRPGRIGGEYHDPDKYSHRVLKEKLRKDENGWDSLDEKISAAEEKKHGIKDLLKRRLRPRPIPQRHAQKDAGTDQSQYGSVSGQGEPPAPSRRAGVPNSPEDKKSSDEDEDGKQKTSGKKKKKNKLKLVDLFKKKSAKKDDVRPPPPTSLPVKEEAGSVKPLLSPTHPPEFYDGVAWRLDQIAQQSVRRKSPTKPEPIQSKEDHKEAIVQQLIQILTTEGDAMNEKIKTNLMLRNSLSRMSYTSFARLLDSCANEAVDPPLPVAESPTLQRVAITMEMTRRVVTATGVTQRMEGYAERYMENFAPWVKSQGGWESIVQKEVQEFD